MRRGKRGGRVGRRVGLLVALLTGAPALPAESQVLGILSLPEVFGDHACDRYVPEDVSLHPSPGSDRVLGRIRVETPWSFPEGGGGCQGLLVKVLDAANGEVHELPVREFGYEAPGLMVLERRGDWFRVRLSDGSGWLRASERSEYHPLEDLLATGLTYLTQAWDGRLAPSPGAAPDRTWGGAPDEHGGTDRVSVHVEDVRLLDGELWVHVVVLSHSPCAVEKPRPVGRGWLRAHASSGEPAIWYYSRGC